MIGKKLLFKIVITLSLVVSSCISLQAEKITVGLIEDKITASNICSAINPYDSVTLQSVGGSVAEAIELANCIREKRVTVEVVTAFSSATFLVLAGHSVCFSPDVEVGFHSPYMRDNTGLVVTYGVNELRRYSIYVSNIMLDWGYSALEIYSVLGITLMTHPNQIRILSYEDTIDLIGDRFIGECK